jgi:hypothetical protein
MKWSLLASSSVALILATHTAAFAQARATDPGATASPPPVTREGIAKDAPLGRDAFSQDQILAGTVEKIVAAPDGRVQAIMLKTGGFLGFGAKVVAIPEGQFHMRGANVQLQLTLEEVQKLPAQRDRS